MSTENEPSAETVEHTMELLADRPKVELTLLQLRQLMAPINPRRVATRTVGQTSLSYVEAYDVKAHLIRIFGYGGFSAEVIDSKVITIREHPQVPQHVNGSGQPKTPEVIAQSTVRLTIFGIGPRGEDAVYTETAIGSNSGWTIGDTMDNAIKSASSDALKRCAIYLGDQFGLSLYNAGSKNAIVMATLNPEQRGLLESDADAVVEGTIEPDEPVNPDAEAQFARALGASAMSDEQRQAVAGEEPQ